MSETSPVDGQANTTAFDAFAGDYDRSFTDSRLGRLLRERVWRVLGMNFHSGQRVLELACGTGEDAVWLAGRGIEVTATDGSIEMVRAANEKAKAAGVPNRVAVQQCSLQDIMFAPDALRNERSFDGVLSNFGGLNTIEEWGLLAEALAARVRPGGRLVLVPMGPVCPWEIVWYAVHRQPDLALRRFRQPAWAQIGAARIPIWYPTAGRLRRAFAPWFAHVHTEGLGLWLPPSYLGEWVSSRERLFSLLERLERISTKLAGGWGDHYIQVLERR